MDQASLALVRREYFLCERLALSALRKAHAVADYDRIARIALPLQEARRQKRTLALDTGAVFLIDDTVPFGRQLLSGCYLVAPPRVGADGRMLRENADAREIPVVVVVREPTTRDGRVPVVAIGPLTLRVRVAPALAPNPLTAPPFGMPTPPRHAPLPPPEWFVTACEALGDSAISSALELASHSARVDALIQRLDTLPDHEKLHQALMDAARQAARSATPKKRNLHDDSGV